MIRKEVKERMIGRTVISMAIDRPSLDEIDEYCYDNRLDRGYFLKVAAMEYLKKNKKQ